MRKIPDCTIEILYALEMVFYAKLSGNSGRPTRLFETDDEMPMRLLFLAILVSITIMETADETIVFLNFCDLFTLGLRV